MTVIRWIDLVISLPKAFTLQLKMIILSWCNANCMTLNISKIKVMYISSKHKQYTVSTEYTPIMISFDSNEIHYSVSPSVILFVGINILIMFLKPVIHISIGWQQAISIYLSLQNRILFYNSYILPHLDYCCIIWV